jgi:hypothetical protein
MPEIPDYTDLATRVADAAGDAATTLEVADTLQRAAEEPGEDPIGPLILALNYDLVSQRNSERREQHGPFAPMVEWDGHQFPPPIGEVDEEALTTWAEVADRSDAPVIVARLSDLLWERRFGERPDQRARAAIDAYAAMRDSQEPIVAADALVRALELARALRDEADGRDLGVDGGPCTRLF